MGAHITSPDVSFRGGQSKPQSNVQDFEAELSVVAKRLEWLTAILGDDESTLTTMITKFTSGDTGQDGASSVASSRDEACVARAGPCPGFEELKLVSTLRDHADKFMSCKSAAELKEVGQGMADLRKLFGTLMGSCKTAMSDLQYAQDQRKATREKQKDKEVTKEKERQERKRMAVKQGGVALKRLNAGQHAVFSFEGDPNMAIVRSKSLSSSLPFEEPFLIHGVAAESVLNELAIQKALVEFQVAFDESSLKVTQGRAGIVADEGVANIVVARCGGLFADPARPDPEVMFDGHTIVDYAELKQSMSVSLFGVAAGHTSGSKFEIGLMPNVRIASKGTRFVATLQARPLIEYLRSTRPRSERITTASMKDWAEGATKDELMDFFAACRNMDKQFPRPLCLSMVNAGEVLYLPPGALVFTRVVNAIDALGVRVGFLTSRNLALLEILQGMGGGANNAMVQAVGYLHTISATGDSQPAHGVASAEQRAPSANPAEEAPSAAPKEEAPSKQATTEEPGPTAGGDKAK